MIIDERIDKSAQNYLESLVPWETGARVQTERVIALAFAAYPEARVTVSYGIACVVAGKRRLYVGAWQHGLSLYGWSADRDAGFATRHRDLRSGKATLRLPPDVLAAMPDEELQEFIAATLAP